MPMFTASSAPQVPQVPISLGLLPNPADPRTMPMMRLGGPAGGQGPTRARGPQNGRGEQAPAYVPKEVLESQQKVADWFQSRPPAAYNVPGYIGTFGNAFMGTYLPARAEARAQENERLSADTARRAAGATSQEAAIAALSGGDPSQRNAAMGARLEALDPARQAQIALAQVQARTAQRELEFQDQLFPPQGAPAAAAQSAPPPAAPPAAAPQAPPPTQASAPPQDASPLPPGPQAVWNANPPPQPEATPPPSNPPVSPQAAPAPAAATDINGDALSVLRTRPLMERRTWYALYKKDPAKAMAQLEEWADPQAAERRVVAREAAEAEGKLVGQARANLPTALQSGASIINNIDAVASDPNLGNITGFQQMPPFRYLPYTPEGQNSLARVEQLQGQAFLQAFNNLRGGGQITEAEGRKASDALARLQNLGQSDAGYLQALEDARREVHSLSNLARRRAGQPEVPYAPNAPTAGKPGAGGETPQRRTINGKNYIKQNGQWFEE